MKKIIAAIVLLVVFYFIVADGMMTVFNYGRGIQYAFNMGALFVLIPFDLYFLLGIDKEDAK